MDIFITAGATCASLLSFFLSLQSLWKSRAGASEVRNKLVIWYLVIFIVSSLSLGLSGFLFHKHVTTFEQSGDFANYPEGVNEIFYAVPYKAVPNLRVDLNDSYSRGGSAQIVEQRANGFKVRLDSLAHLWGWRAIGIPVDNPDAQH